MRSIKDKVILITGSSQGIGKALALQCLRQGANVCINGRSEKKLLKTQQQLKRWHAHLFAVAADVSTDEGSLSLVEACVQHFRRLDIVVCNAGMSAYGELEKTAPTVIHEVIDTNIKAAALVTHFALPHLTRCGGSIVLVSSLAGIHGLGGYSLYSASKMAYTALGQSLQKELKHQSVHVGIVYLGFVANENSKRTLNAAGKLEPIPERKQMKVDSRENAAQLILSCILKKKPVVVHTIPGKLNHLLSRYFPGLVHWILQKVYRQNFLQKASA